MRLILMLCALVVLVNAHHEDGKEHYKIKDAPKLFEEFKEYYNRVYKNPEDEAVHFAAFVETLKNINESNDHSTSATFGINKFADYTLQEQRQLLGVLPYPKHEPHH